MTTTPRLDNVDLTVGDDGVAIVTLDREGDSINAIGPDLMADIEAVLDRLENDDTVRAAVITSAKDDFVVGADIRWFSELTSRTAHEAIVAGHALFDRLESLHRDRGKPVVAAIHGAALGGGTEVALACSHRVVSDHPRTQLGQPEVQLGVIPAGGGTQRLPALIGLAAALDLILTGRPVKPARARKIGLVDAVVPAEKLLEVAKRTALAALGHEVRARGSWRSPAGLKRAALEGNPLGRAIVFKQARNKVMEETRGNYPAPLRALEAVQSGIEAGGEAGYAAEARFFAELVVSPESKALRSIFFATRELGKDRGAASDVEPRPVAKVAVIGGGLMGGGIAAVSTLPAGRTVRIKEVDVAGVNRALGYVSKVMAARVDRRRMSVFEAEKAMLRVTGTTDWSGFRDVDLVIEAVFEDLELKRHILAETEGIVGPSAVFASNTSTLPITRIAEASSRPETVLGMHYFSPVEKMPLLEVVVTEATADWAVATAVAFGKAQGKTVIVVNDGTGFYTSRIVAPYSNEALRLLEEGAKVEEIDQALVAWGFPVGPLMLADEVGLDVGAKVAKILVDAFGERMAGPAVMASMGDRKGRKNRKGFYTYDSSGKRGDPDETVYSELGPRRAIARAEIQERVSLMMINEAALCLGDGVLRSARDGDIGAVMGLGFPPFRGGPFWYVDHVGAGEIVARLDRLAASFGDRFRPAGILRRAAQERTIFRA